MIGVVGGGQLAKLLIDAAQKRDVGVFVQTLSAQDPAAKYASKLFEFAPENLEGTRAMGKYCQCVTFENEWVDTRGLSRLEKEGINFLPPLKSLTSLVDKLSQRRLLNHFQIPSPEWVEITCDNLEDFTIPKGWEFPFMAKTCRGGYDGKGTKIIKNFNDLEIFFRVDEPKEWFLEKWIDYDKELALVLSRDQEGKIRSFPLSETCQYKQVCDWVLAPATVSHQVENLALNIASSLLTELNYIGVLAIEFFYGADGLLVNEIAPRTHNSGHFSIDACNSSQFDQQLCIAAELEAPIPKLIYEGALMVNLLGFSMVDSPSLEERLEKIRKIEGAKLHWYNKVEHRPGRKLGHVTFLLKDKKPSIRREKAFKLLKEIRSIWPMNFDDVV